MTGVKKQVFPTTTVHAVRLALFQPTRRPVDEERLIETPWGLIRRKARLGQQHADVLEAMFYCHEKRKDMEDGAIKLLVDPAQVRRRARQDGTTLQRIIDDLQRAIIEIIQPAHLACQGQIVGHINKAMRADGTPITRYNPLTRGERALWSVTLGPVLSRLVHSDIWVGYDPAPIARLQHGISQAIARHVLTHKHEPNGGWTLDGLIRAVAGDIDDVSMRHRRREARADVEALAAAGVLLECDRVRRVQQNRDSVQQNRDSVQQNRDSVQQNRDACSKTAAVADTYSDNSGAGV